MNMISIWDILELEPTSDTKAIKRAYAKKLKITRPDEDPKGFQDLHSAYKRALQEAVWIAEREAEDYQEDYDEDHEEDEHDYAEDGYRGNNQDTLKQIHSTFLQVREPEQEQAQDLIRYQIEQQVPNETPTPKGQLIINQTHLIDESIPENNPVDAQEFDLNFTDQNELIKQDDSFTPDIIQPVINPFQQEGERLLQITQLLLASNGDQAKAESWEFIVESPMILEDHFNWRLGLEILQMIREHNLNHVSQVPKIVGQDALTYLDTIFNWNANRPQILRVMGNEYQTWLDMIRDPDQQDENWQDKIRGGKKLTFAKDKVTEAAQIRTATNFQRFIAWLIDVLLLGLIVPLTQAGDSNLSPLVATLVFPLLYFAFFESSPLQGTIGKRLFGLKVVNLNIEPVKISQGFLRTFCFLIYQLLLLAVLTGVSIGIPFAAIFIVGVYCYSFSKDPTLLYDRITKTRVIQTRNE